MTFGRGLEAFGGPAPAVTTSNVVGLPTGMSEDKIIHEKSDKGQLLSFHKIFFLVNTSLS